MTTSVKEHYVIISPEMATPEKIEWFIAPILAMLNAKDSRPAKEQFNDAYAHGGGWSPLDGWTMDPETFALNYPGDPPMGTFAKLVFGEERIFLYDHAWVAIVQPDGKFEVARMD